MVRKREEHADGVWEWEERGDPPTEGGYEGGSGSRSKTGEQAGRRRRRSKAEVYITRHVAQIIQRHEFILKLTRALMMLGAPRTACPPRSTPPGCMLDNCSCMYLPNVVVISLDDGATGTSSLTFVIHDEESVSEVSRTLDALMRKKKRNVICVDLQYQPQWQLSPLGALLMAIQLLNVRNELYSNLFEFTAATLFGFVSAHSRRPKSSATSPSRRAPSCSSSRTFLLPPPCDFYLPLPQGFMVRRPPIIPRNIVSGSVRMRYAVVYSLFLGLGLAVGVDDRITGRSTDYTCSESHDTEGRGIRRLGVLDGVAVFEHAESGAVGGSGDGPARRPRVHRLAHSRGASYVSFLSRNAFVIMSTAYLAGFQTALQLISVVIGDDGLGLSLALTVVDMGLFMGR
ncbi:DUF1212-domain-containing protein [Mycena alexandri]|uniref:DUF1212-domain-containing protein n=1 Tax=Mycena alexandri TaxID=1745969 RepID=A0AAD6WQK5_9AGAR|nr:DUF1212-domain-containing protein [Mycena alexandri]